jgi:hypothetical protein
MGAAQYLFTIVDQRCSLNALITFLPRIRFIRYNFVFTLKRALWIKQRRFILVAFLRILAAVGADKIYS